MSVCPGSTWTTLSDPCIRGFWSALIPVVLVVLYSATHVPWPVPEPVKRVYLVIKSPFTNFLTLEEAEGLLSQDEDVGGAEEVVVIPPLWRGFVITSLSLVETLVWIGVGSYLAVVYPTSLVANILPFLLAISWLYASLRLVVSPSVTPPYDLFVLYSVHWIFGVLTLAGAAYDHYVHDLPLPSTWTLVAETAHWVLVSYLMVIILGMPLNIPSPRVAKQIGNTVTPEDYTSLWGWMSFKWIRPLINKGTNATLNEPDVWNLSPFMRSQPLYVKFSQTPPPATSLIRKLWVTNSLDILMDFLLTYVSIIFNYLGPFFLKQILDSLSVTDTDRDEGKDKEVMYRAYVYAFLAFLSTLCKAEADVQHLWFGRRAGTRMRSELMSAIYDKALKRKDFSGIVDKDKGKEAKDPQAASKEPKDSKADDPKAGADIGKIVNLMANDANRICQVMTGMYFIYGAPFELIVASVFLYQLLGISAFSGFLILLLMWPLNNYLANRTFRIRKGLSNAQDKRMGVLNEVIGAIKFIKFFAWEDRWVERALNAREVELKWLVKARMNHVFLSFIWSLAPILVSIIAFFTFVMTGHELTVGTAFTAIALFGMVRQPLNVLPVWIVQILQTGVSIKRISTYLDEDEVDEQVSTLKKPQARSSDNNEDDEPGLGIINGSFKWNEVEEKLEDKDNNKKKTSGASDSNSSSNTQSTVVGESDTHGEGDLGAEGDHRFELRDITVMFPEGELTVVTGPTASGKTALLMALLGELTLINGRLIMSKSPTKRDSHGNTHAISYASQTPWLRHQSIKENILFGYPYDEKRYKDVIEACALGPDLEIFEDGDDTEIGARGVSLSGGQKARVALARAVYAPTKYVLLDDPLSAVDSHTARFLFEKLLGGPLLQNRTVILVTHHVELVLPGTHYLVRMLDGRIDTQGTVKELREQGILDDIAHDESVEAHKAGQAAEEPPSTAVDGGEIEGDVEDNEHGKKKKKPRKLVEDEKRETGSVKWRIYKTYLQASSYITWSILFTLIVIRQFLGVGEKFWIKYWGQAYGDTQGGFTNLYTTTSFITPEDQIPMGSSFSSQHIQQPLHLSFNVSSPPFIDVLSYNWPRAQEHPFFYIGIYSAITLGAALVNIISVITQYTGALRASRVLFKKLLLSVVRATMRWHDTTPQGRMLNRFSKDIETIDSSLAGTLQSVNQSLAVFAASVLTIVYIFPWFIIPAFFIGYVYRRLAIGYLNTGRDLRRMESNTRSPIFSNFGELLEGIVTVRAFSAEQRFLEDLYRKVDLTTKMWYMFWMTNRWLLLNFDALGAFGVFITTLFALSGYVDAGLAGVCITSAMAFTDSVYWACRFWTALELDLNSVERVVEYLSLPSEPPTVIPESRPPAYWPSSTGPNKDALIRVEDLVVKYSPELPPVLHGVSFSVKAGERVGLLGRTGSGKSTLAMSLLRFVDPAEGKIIIDGIDITTIGLHDLRSRITFIPQDATLFSGTLRENLDPFSTSQPILSITHLTVVTVDEHDDSECLDVLYRVQMITEPQLNSQRTSREPSRPSSVHNVPVPSSGASGTDTPMTTNTSTTLEAKTSVVTLDTQVSPGGTNFSQGQRQLIAMARALLRRNSIIVLDEATSSIDFATDAKIQGTIREELGGVALLTIAHRLRTIIDYDRLLVLDKGQLVEFDTPWNLIQKEGGVFRKMCLRSGSYAELEGIAKEKAKTSGSVI
ncbi:multidrug resistance-associated ABC transporter [Panus rudis PR-1116 ss-1]|nr:multidrug resistance-associated ABC transporter [Panus rudis PR-1116 ss-1]